MTIKVIVFVVKKKKFLNVELSGANLKFFF